MTVVKTPGFEFFGASEGVRFCEIEILGHFEIFRGQIVSCFAIFGIQSPRQSGFLADFGIFEGQISTWITIFGPDYRSNLDFGPPKIKEPPSGTTEIGPEIKTSDLKRN